jgi:ribosome-binding factor A
MKPFARADRVGEEIQKVLSELLHRQIRDPRLNLTVITAVRVSRDLKHARIYYSVSGGDPKAVRRADAGFTSAKGFVKKELAARLELRYMPELRFYYDESFDYGEHIEQLLQSIGPHDGSDH